MTSIARKFFTPKPDEPIIAVCNICNDRIRRGKEGSERGEWSTGTLLDHLDSHHKSELIQKRKELEPALAAKKAKKASSAGDLNRYPCTCSPATGARVHDAGCERQKRTLACQEAASLGRPFEHASVPKPEKGEIVEYLGSALPLFGGLCCPKSTTRNGKWIRVGRRCGVCSGFDGALQFQEERKKLKSKFGVHVAVCSCPGSA